MPSETYITQARRRGKDIDILRTADGFSITGPSEAEK